MYALEAEMKNVPAINKKMYHAAVINSLATQKSFETAK